MLTVNCVIFSLMVFTFIGVVIISGIMLFMGDLNNIKSKGKSTTIRSYASKTTLNETARLSTFVDYLTENSTSFMETIHTTIEKEFKTSSSHSEATTTAYKKFLSDATANSTKYTTTAAGSYWDNCKMYQAKKVNPVGRILRGDVVMPHAFPWLVSLREYNDVFLYDHFCAGVLITPDRILTAAHCVSKLNPKNLLAILGLHQRNDVSLYAKRNTYKVSKIIVHEGYRKSTNENDIALIQLEKPTVLNENISVICLPDPREYKDYEALNQRELSVAGWGLNEFDVPSIDLKQTKMEILSRNESQCAHNMNDFNRNLVYCARSFNSVANICSGDSGGSLALHENGQWTLVGIASYVTAYKLRANDTKVYCNPSNPSFYTRVSLYIEWIIQNLK